VATAIERLQALGVSRFWAAAIPVLIFATGHSTSGWPNIIVALIAGSILAVFYQKRRDLPRHFTFCVAFPTRSIRVGWLFQICGNRKRSGRCNREKDVGRPGADGFR